MHPYTFEHGEEPLAVPRTEPSLGESVRDRTAASSLEQTDWGLHPKAGWDRFQEARDAVIRRLRSETGGTST